MVCLQHEIDLCLDGNYFTNGSYLPQQQQLFRQHLAPRREDLKYSGRNVHLDIEGFLFQLRTISRVSLASRCHNQLSHTSWLDQDIDIAHSAPRVAGYDLVIYNTMQNTFLCTSLCYLIPLNAKTMLNALPPYHKMKQELSPLL
jgi:hypothetical protein